MIRKALHILVIAILALNLMGAWAFASAFDCGMACCQPSETAEAGIPTIEAASCCQMSDVTCGFETGQYEELFDTAICCFTGSADQDQASADLIADKVNTDTPTPRYTVTVLSTGPPQTTPVYLSNAAFLC
jgi:hypothetical protein